MRKIFITTAVSAALAGCAVVAPPIAVPGPVPIALAGTHWRVAAVNGAGTRADGTFFMNFDANRFSAKFGCNGLAADYVQRGDVLDAGPVIGTQMACPNMNFETEAQAILAQDLRVTWTIPENLRLINDRGTIDLIRG